MKTLAPHVESSRIAHHNALLSLYRLNKPTTGLAIWRKLCRIERDAHNATTAQCNGAGYNGQPFREEEEWEAFKRQIRSKVLNIFGTVPQGFFVNGDARGYALKIDPDNGTVPAGMHADWGQNGILAAQIE